MSYGSLLYEPQIKLEYEENPRIYRSVQVLKRY
jgi:hypothetical protein